MDGGSSSGHDGMYDSGGGGFGGEGGSDGGGPIGKFIGCLVILIILGIAAWAYYNVKW